MQARPLFTKFDEFRQRAQKIIALLQALKNEPRFSAVLLGQNPSSDSLSSDDWKALLTFKVAGLPDKDHLCEIAKFIDELFILIGPEINKLWCEDKSNGPLGQEELLSVLSSIFPVDFDYSDFIKILENLQEYSKGRLSNDFKGKLQNILNTTQILFVKSQELKKIQDEFNHYLTEVKNDPSCKNRQLENLKNIWAKRIEDEKSNLAYFYGLESLKKGDTTKAISFVGFAKELKQYIKVVAENPSLKEEEIVKLEKAWEKHIVQEQKKFAGKAIFCDVVECLERDDVGQARTVLEKLNQPVEPAENFLKNMKLVPGVKQKNEPKKSKPKVAGIVKKIKQLPRKDLNYIDDYPLGYELYIKIANALEKNNTKECCALLQQFGALLEEKQNTHFVKNLTEIHFGKYYPLSDAAHLRLEEIKKSPYFKPYENNHAQLLLGFKSFQKLESGPIGFLEGIFNRIYNLDNKSGSLFYAFLGYPDKGSNLEKGLTVAAYCLVIPGLFILAKNLAKIPFEVVPAILFEAGLNAVDAGLKLISETAKFVKKCANYHPAVGLISALFIGVPGVLVGAGVAISGALTSIASGITHWVTRKILSPFFAKKEDEERGYDAAKRLGATNKTAEKVAKVAGKFSLALSLTAYTFAAPVVTFVAAKVLLVAQAVSLVASKIGIIGNWITTFFNPVVAGSTASGVFAASIVHDVVQHKRNQNKIHPENNHGNQPPPPPPASTEDEISTSRRSSTASAIKGMKVSASESDLGMAGVRTQNVEEKQAPVSALARSMSMPADLRKASMFVNAGRFSHIEKDNDAEVKPEVHRNSISSNP